MWPEWLQEISERHRFKVLGGLGGLVFSLLVLRFGLFWALFIAACTAVGYWVGKKLDESPESFAEFFERILPPGSGR